jgi:hypothetical protein
MNDLSQNNNVFYLAGSFGVYGPLSVTIGNKVKKIPAYLFNSSAIRALFINQGDCEQIGEGAFMDCSYLTLVTIPNTVKIIGSASFHGCINIGEIHVPAMAIPYIPTSKLSIVEITGGDIIEDKSFKDCKNLSTIIIPDSITEIGEDAFSGCWSLSGVYISDLKSWCNLSLGNYESSPLNAGAAPTLYLNTRPITELIIPEGVDRIPTCAFRG